LEADPGPVLRRYRLDGRPVVLCAGRLTLRKGQDTLIRALPHVLAAHPDAALLIVGRGPRARALAGMVRRAGLKGSVIMTGGVPFQDMPAFYAAATVFAGPSRTLAGGLTVEGFPLVYMEAQGSGLPTIVGRSGGAPEAVLDGETGLVVDGTKPAQVAAAIVGLLDSPARAAAMGRAGRQWVESNWDWSERAATLQSLLSA
jgi:phosphatidylinositol alpha-1,6-mannosyltransferase